MVFTRFLLAGFGLLAIVQAGLASRLEDVFILVNNNVQESREVTEYYCRKRGVPERHIIPLDLPKGEDITRQDFDKRLVVPLRAALQARREKIKILLSTYGVPLRVGPREPNVLGRLDGPSVAIVKGLVDQAVEVEALDLAGKVYVDARGIKYDPKGGEYTYGAYHVAERQYSNGHPEGQVMSTPQLRQDCAVQPLVLGESLVECDQLKRGGSCESGQVCVAPYLRRKGPSLRECPPLRFDPCRLLSESNARIAHDGVINLPRFLQRDGL